MIVNDKHDDPNDGEIELTVETDGAPVPGSADLGGGASLEETQVSPSACCSKDATEAILDSLTEMKATVASQGEALTELGQRDALFTRLHERLAACEQDERSRSFLEPLARRAAPISRRLQEQAAQARSAFESLPQPLRRSSPYHWAFRALEATRAELETLLGDLGIETFVASGNVFDRCCQKAVERVTADDSQKTGEIARRIAPGLRVGGRVIVAERVTVYVARNGRQSS